MFPHSTLSLTNKYHNFMYLSHYLISYHSYTKKSCWYCPGILCYYWIYIPVTQWSIDSTASGVYHHPPWPICTMWRSWCWYYVFPTFLSLNWVPLTEWTRFDPRNIHVKHMMRQPRMSQYWCFTHAISMAVVS